MNIDIGEIGVGVNARKTLAIIGFHLLSVRVATTIQSLGHFYFSREKKNFIPCRTYMLKSSRTVRLGIRVLKSTWQPIWFLPCQKERKKESIKWSMREKKHEVD